MSKKIDQYNEVEENGKDTKFAVVVIFPALLVCIVIAGIWTYAQMLGAL